MQAVCRLDRVATLARKGWPLMPMPARMYKNKRRLQDTLPLDMLSLTVQLAFADVMRFRAATPQQLRRARSMLRAGLGAKEHSGDSERNGARLRERVRLFRLSLRGRVSWSLARPR